MRCSVLPTAHQKQPVYRAPAVLAPSAARHQPHSSLQVQASVPHHVCQATSCHSSAHQHNTFSRPSIHPATGTGRCQWLACAAQGEAGPEASSSSAHLYTLLQDRGVLLSAETFQQKWRDTPAWRELGADTSLHELEAGLVALLGLFSGADVARLLTVQPALLTAPLESWLMFFKQFGFTSGQIKNLIAQFPEVLVQGSIADAGLAILHLKRMGFTDDAVRHKVVAFCPQVLMMSPPAIDSIVKMWSRFNAGVTERVGM